MGLVLSLLTEKALKWASPLLERSSPLLEHFESLVQPMAGTFDNPNQEHSTEAAFHALQQGLTSVTKYAEEFQCLTADTTDVSLRSSTTLGRGLMTL